MKLDPFYPIWDSSEWLERLLPHGVCLVQLRIKSEDMAHVRNEVAKAREFCREYDCQLVVNDYWQIAIELGCDAVHLGQSDLDNADVTAIADAGIKLGISTHSPAELERALTLQPFYIALGPIYPTILKQMPWQPQGLERIAQWKRLIGEIPLVALGGLNPQRAEAALDQGADMVAVVTDITLNPDPESRLQAWLKCTEPYRTRKLLRPEPC